MATRSTDVYIILILNLNMEEKMQKEIGCECVCSDLKTSRSHVFTEQLSDAPPDGRLRALLLPDARAAGHLCVS